MITVKVIAATEEQAPSVVNLMKSPSLTLLFAVGSAVSMSPAADPE